MSSIEDTPNKGKYSWDRFTNKDFLSVAKVLRGGLFKTYDPNKTPHILTYIFNKSKINDEDDIIDKVFKSLIITGSIMDATKYLNDIGCKTNKNRVFTTTDVSDYIFYDKSSNAEITIIAKSIYYYTCQNKGMLEWQINKLIETGDMESYEQEVINYHKYKEDNNL